MKVPRVEFLPWGVNYVILADKLYISFAKEKLKNSLNAQISERETNAFIVSLDALEGTNM
jgi:hypothetical protein